MSGPKIPVAIWADEQKYRQEGEEYNQKVARVASALSDNEEHFIKFKDILKDQRFLPGGRVQAAAGSYRRVTAFNCFTGDTRIITEEGVKSLADIVGDSEVVYTSLFDGDGKLRRNVPVYKHGVQPVYGVTLQNGHKKHTLFATEDHEWVISGSPERIVTKDLKAGQKVPHAKPNTQVNHLGIVHGLVYGDGVKNSDGRGYSLVVCDHHDVTYAHLDGYPYSDKNPYGRTYYFYGNNAHTNLKELPSDGASPEYLKGFFMGLHLADGCVTTQPELIITGNQELLDWVQIWGPVAGWHPTGYSKLTEETNFGVRKNDTFNIRFDVRGMATSVLKGADRLQEYTPRNNDWRITDVWFEGEQVVYCPSVDTTKSFLHESGAVLGNCFVMQKVPDSMVGIMDVAKEAAVTMQLGGGVGYDFSSIRPKGARIKSIGSKASGPVSFMGIMDALCKTIASAGHRRGAQMGCLRVDHPDIMEFISAKANHDQLTQFNISVLITDEFMEAVMKDEDFDLKFEDVVYDRVRASSLWETILRNTWDWAEPGVIFIDRVNKMNNLWYCEDISATNP